MGEDGYMLSNTWIGNYYLGADGAMLVNTTTPDGYQVGADGAWIPGENVQDTRFLEKYAEVLRKLIKEQPPKDRYNFNNHTFRLIYVDEDSIPELLVYVSSYKPDPHLYTYYQGNAVLLGNFYGWAQFSYAERKNRIYSVLWNNGGRQDDDFYYIKNGEMIPITKFFYDESAQYYPVGGIVYDYLINDQLVPRSTYESQLNALKNEYPYKNIKADECHEVSEENIQKMLAD